jgi:hypothetical membrane protein
MSGSAMPPLRSDGQPGRAAAPGGSVSGRAEPVAGSRVHARDPLVVAGLVGVLAIVVGCIVAALAYEGSAGERYSPLNHWISELGEIGVSELAAVFNAGLVIGGACFVAFHVGLARGTTGWLRFVIAVFGVVSGVAGALVGVFPMNRIDIHRLVALTFFLTGWIGPALLALRLLPGARDGLPRWLAIPGFAAAVAFLAFLAVVFAPHDTSSLAVPDERPAFWLAAALEWATLAAILCWTACVALVIVRRPDNA